MIYLILYIHLAIIIEALLESKHGDKHGFKSNLSLGLIMLGAEIVGYLFAGVQFGLVFYVVYRFAEFDYLYSWFKHGHIWYVGKTAHTDNLYHKTNKKVAKIICWIKGDKSVFKKIHEDVVQFARGATLVLRIILTITTTIYLIRL